LGNTNPFYEAHGSNKDTPKLLEDPKLTAIGAKYEASPAQTALAWGISHGRSVLSKSVSPERIRQNLAAASISLAPADQQEIDSLDRKARFDDTSKMFGYKFYVGLD
jgi:diketogulonate reductase-like aldo/keto reductase